MPAADADVPQPPNGRAWELVSDPSTESSAPPIYALGVVAAGDRIVYLRFGSGPGAPIGSVLGVGMAVRGAGGWTDASLGYPYPFGSIYDMASIPRAATADMSTLIWNSVRPLLPGAPGSGEDSGWYSAAPGGPLTLLSAGGRPGEWASLLSEDGERVILETSVALSGDDSLRAGGGNQVYEISGGGERLLGIDEGGGPIGPCGTAGVSALATPNPASADGRRVFVSAPGCEQHPEVLPRVFLNEDGEATELSASQCARPDCGPPAAVFFAGATPDGAAAYLVTTAQLTDDDVDDSGDLYRYEVADGSLTRVSSGAVPADAIATRVYPSDDGGRVYFLARGELVPGQGTSGSPNMYVLDGEGLRFVATLAEDDTWPMGTTNLSAFSDVDLTPGAGSRVLLATKAALRAEDTDAALDLYLYSDAEGGPPLLVSKTAYGGNAEEPVRMSRGVLHNLPRFARAAPRMLADDGRRVLFMTNEPLLPQDTDSATDVYEWFDGTVRLLSVGGDARDVLFLGASLDGASVFISTPERLVSADDDAGDYDLYAARIGGGFPESAPPRGECEDGCPSSPPPGRLTRRDPPTISHRDRAASAQLRLRAPTRHQRARMVARGQLALAVRASAAGRVSALARARVGGRDRIVGRGRRHVAKAGTTVMVRVPLTRAARRRLASGRRLAVRVVVRHSRLDGASARARLVLRGRS